MRSTPILSTRHGRERLVVAALNLTNNTTLAPDDYERQLLEDFVRGVMTIDEVVRMLDVRMELTQLSENS